jgi:SsrA-binding protein
MSDIKIIIKNKKARFEYHILETIEAGIVLLGTEVKSLRLGNVNMVDAYAAIQKGEVFLKSLNISEYKYGNIENHEPTRVRKLLLKKNEIKKIKSKLQEKGLTLIPTMIYLSHGLVKVELGLCKGKKLYDKRETIKARDIERNMKDY